MNHKFLTIVSSFIAVLIVLPLLAIIPLSFSDSQLLVFPIRALTLDWYIQISSTQWLAGYQVTFLLLVVSTSLSVVIAVSAIYSIEKLIPSLERITNVLLILPVLVPTPVLALGYYILFKIELRQTSFLTLAAAYSIMGVPYAYTMLRIAFAKFPESLEKAAMTLGASPLRAFLQVRLFSARRFVLYAGLLIGLIILDDVTLAYFLADDFRTVGTLLWDGIRINSSPVILAVSVLNTMIGIGLGFFMLSNLQREQETAL